MKKLLKSYRIFIGMISKIAINNDHTITHEKTEMNHSISLVTNTLGVLSLVPISEKV